MVDAMRIRSGKKQCLLQKKVTEILVGIFLEKFAEPFSHGQAWEQDCDIKRVNLHMNGVLSTPSKSVYCSSHPW